MRALSLDQLQSFVTVLELGSFSATARALHLAQPTISLHIAELESRLDTPLLVRSKQRVHATPAGLVLAEHARRLLRDAAEAALQVQRHRTGISGRVRLGSSTGAMVHLLPQVLETLDATLPDVDVHVSIERSSVLMDRVALGDVDLALLAMPAREHPNVQVRPWRVTPVMAMLPAAWAAPRAVTPRWLAGRPLILNEPDTQIRRQVMDWFAADGLLPRGRIELAFNEVTRRLVAAGYGAAILPYEHPSEALDGRIRVLPLRPALRRVIGVASRRGTVPAGALQRVLEAVLAFGQPEAARGRRRTRAATSAAPID